jgi:2-C-methyl-D-erythritol 4-phosphate cytidylyltransferase
VVVCHPERVSEYRASAIDGTRLRKVVAVVPGGATRRLSVAAGLAALPAEADIVAVHDGARPLITPYVVDGAVEALLGRSDADGLVVGHPAYDTVKTVDGDRRITGTPDRAGLWFVQTPQVFRTAALRRAHARAAIDGFEGTDDASLVERDGGTVLVWEGPRWNVKVTMPEDLEVVEALSALREGRADG